MSAKGRVRNHGPFWILSKPEFLLVGRNERVYSRRRRRVSRIRHQRVLESETSYLHPRTKLWIGYSIQRKTVSSNRGSMTKVAKILGATKEVNIFDSDWRANFGSLADSFEPRATHVRGRLVRSASLRMFSRSWSLSISPSMKR